MYKVEIFVKTKFHGRLTNGKGVVAIAIRLKDRPDTVKFRVQAWKDLSYQRLSARAALMAITRMVAPAQVKIYIDSVYACSMMQKDCAGGYAHEKIWQQYYDVVARMETVEVEFVKTHEYTDKLTKMISEGVYIVETDKEE